MSFQLFGRQFVLPFARSSHPLLSQSFSTTELSQPNKLRTFSAMASIRELRARTILRSADAVCFDVDSTVIQDEAIDELARFADKEKEVSEL